jgi:hypothetical protein
MGGTFFSPMSNIVRHKIGEFAGLRRFLRELEGERVHRASSGVCCILASEGAQA